MQDELERSFSFTARGNRLVQETVNAADFQQMDARLIYQSLKDQLVFVPFAEYLKRYIYQTSGMFGSYRQVPQEEYAATLADAFRETGTPGSFRPSSQPLSARIKRWLTQASVRREVVMMLGFALSMPEKDVNDFLTNALHDHRLNEEEPLEAICAYCYRHGYRYPKALQLMRIYEVSVADGTLNRDLIVENQPAGREASQVIIEEDAALLRRLVERREYTGSTEQEARTRRHFQRLYDQALGLYRHETPGINGETGQSSCAGQDLSTVLCAAIPRDRHGNLVSEIHSSLREKITGKRFSRQHVHELLSGAAEPSRYDLITLRFLICAEDKTTAQDPKLRCVHFIDDMNRILLDCGFGTLYTGDPYECFMLMCILSVDPLGSYMDVMELSYQADGKQAE